jgi:hypothetical protein
MAIEIGYRCDGCAHIVLADSGDRVSRDGAVEFIAHLHLPDGWKGRLLGGVAGLERRFFVQCSESCGRRLVALFGLAEDPECACATATNPRIVRAPRGEG